MLSRELFQALSGRSLGGHHLVGRRFCTPAVGYRDEHLARRKALALAVGGLCPGYLGLYVHVKPVRFAPPGGSQ